MPGGADIETDPHRRQSKYVSILHGIIHNISIRYMRIIWFHFSLHYFNNKRFKSLSVVTFKQWLEWLHIYNYACSHIQ